MWLVPLYMQLFAREYPKDVKGLILIDSVGQNDPFQDSLPDSLAPYFLEAKGVSISKEQVREAGPFPNIPVIILAAGIHKWATEKEQRQLLFEQKKLLALSPQSELIIVKNSGHYIQNEQPEAIIQAIHSIWIKVKS